MIEGQWYSTVHHRRMTTWGGAAATLWGLFVMFVVLDPSTGGETSLAYGRFVAVAWIGSGLILLLRGRRAAVRVGTLGLDVRNAWRSSFYRWERGRAAHLRLGPPADVDPIRARAFPSPDRLDDDPFDQCVDHRTTPVEVTRLPPCPEFRSVARECLNDTDGR